MKTHLILMALLLLVSLNSCKSSILRKSYKHPSSVEAYQTIKKLSQSENSRFQIKLINYGCFHRYELIAAFETSKDSITYRTHAIDSRFKVSDTTFTFEKNNFIKTLDFYTRKGDSIISLAGERQDIHITNDSVYVSILTKKGRPLTEILKNGRLKI